MGYDFMDYAESAYVNGYDIGDNLEWVKRDQPSERRVEAVEMTTDSWRNPGDVYYKGRKLREGIDYERTESFGETTYHVYGSALDNNGYGFDRDDLSVDFD